MEKEDLLLNGLVYFREVTINKRGEISVGKLGCTQLKRKNQLSRRREQRLIEKSIVVKSRMDSKASIFLFALLLANILYPVEAFTAGSGGTGKRAVNKKVKFTTIALKVLKMYRFQG